MRLILLTLLCSLASVTVTLASPATGEPAPGFTSRSASGEEITFPREQNGVDLYFFWATWCPFCKAFMPHLQSIEEEYGDQVRIFAFQIRDEEDGAEFLDRYGFTFELMPQADDLMPLYNVKGTPGLFLVDHAGVTRLNLRELSGLEIPNAENLKRSQIAARTGPWWAAQVRVKLDEILAEQ